jgi:hypothetical protein
MKLKLDDACYITNRGSMPTLIEMDFDDGLGWRTINFGDVISVDYGVGDSGEHIVKTRITRSGSQLKAASLIEYAENFDPCASTLFPFPDTAPWPTDASTTTNWQLHVEYNGELVYGNAYTLISEDGVFDKPFLFAEGIDFGWDLNDNAIHKNLQNGEFGWCQFTSGNDDPEYHYDMLARMPELLDAVRAYGYDIILLDFYDVRKRPGV